MIKAKKYFFMYLILAGTAINVFGALELVNSGKSDYTICVSKKASPAEQTAAKEFQRYIKEISGCKLPIQTTPANKTVYIGQNNVVSKLLPEINFAKLQSDEIVIITKGNALILAGGRPRGTLYAVYTFLEEQLGVRWWTAAESTVPKNTSITVPILNIRYAPFFVGREVFCYDMNHYPKFAARLKSNGDKQKLGPELGGRLRILGFVHTFDILVPPKKYFAAHPEYYSLVKGKRLAGQYKGQLCLSNPELRKLLVKNTLDWISKNPDITVVSVSPNDNFNYCRCNKCAAFAAKEESQAANVLLAVNEVADAVKLKYPDVFIETIAYNWSEKAPKTIRPRDNVVVRLCSSDSSFAQPLNGPQNKTFFKALKAWSKISKQLAIWNYTTCFPDYLLPYPTDHVLAKNIRLYRKYKAKWIFEQGDNYSNTGGDMIALRNWVIAHLLWNPDLDQEKLTDEFLIGYYGAAAPYLKKYLNEREKAISASGLILHKSISSLGWLNASSMRKMTKILDDAVASVKDDAILLRRVKLMRLTFDFARVIKYGEAIAAQIPTENYMLPADMPAFARKLCAFAKNNGVGGWREGKIHTFPEFEKRILKIADRKPMPVPEKFKNLKPDRYVDLPASAFRRWRYSKVVKDAQAVNGTAVALPMINMEWELQYKVPAGILKKGNKFRIYLSLRKETTKEAPRGAIVGFGCYNRSPKSHDIGKAYQANALNTSKYTWLDMGSFKLRADTIIWIGPRKNPGVKKIFFDRIILIRE